MSSKRKESLRTLVASCIPPDELSEDIVSRLVGLGEDIFTDYQDVNPQYDSSQIGDIIKKKLWRDNNAPDKAMRFTNLYSRLLTQPIISNKWAILQLLDHLSEFENLGTPEDEEPAPQTPGQSRLAQDQYVETRRFKSQHEDQQLRSSLQDASSARLNQQPSEDEKPRPRRTSRRIAETKSNQVPQPMSTSAESSFGTQRDSRSSNAPLEAAILRDLPFILQGLSTENMTFTDDNALNLPSGLDLPTISLLHTLAEPALLYRSLSTFVESSVEGLIGQSLRSAVNVELRSYLALIATLESEIKTTISEKGNEGGLTKLSGLVTLKRVVVWTRDATMGLRLMSSMAEESKKKKGGQLISMIHKFKTSYGDPFIKAFAERMLGHLTKPFYAMLQQWIYDGELSDPYHEFFVAEQDIDMEVKNLDPRGRAAATSVWEDKYKLDKELVPTIITDEFAQKVFLIGKSLNFLRYGCGDSYWVEAYSKDATTELQYGDTGTLESSIDQAYKTTMARLVHLMDDKFHLFEHLEALKKYLLLGQGDFVALLMESLASNLDRPAGSQYRHTLTAQLEHAIRGSNAQFDSPDVLRRLDARLLELSHGDIGWDVFTLEYKVDAPVDVVITPWANKQYLMVFNFLWRIKRVEFALNSTWKRFTTGARGVLGSVNDKLGKDWKSARCVVGEMVHFINQLQYYILFEVIEASWDQLQSAVRKPACTLDDLIDAHTLFLKAITHKGLLGSTRSPITGLREDSFMSQLHYLLKIMLAYRDAVDGLYSFSVAEFTRRQELHARIETRTAAGTWGLTANDNNDDHDFNSPLPGPGDRLRSKTLRSSEAAADGGADSPNPFAPGVGLAHLNDEQMLPALRTRLKDLSVEFRVRLTTLLGDLLLQPDPDLKFLGVEMNFNDVYRPSRRKKVGGGKERDARTPAPAARAERAGSAAE